MQISLFLKALHSVMAENNHDLFEYKYIYLLYKLNYMIQPAKAK